MSWMELSIDTTEEAVDWVCTLLAEANYTGEVRIAKYAEPELQHLTEQQEIQPSWAFTIYLYLPYDGGVRAKTEKIASLISPLQRTGLTTELQMAVVEEKPTDQGILNPLVHRIGQRFVVLSDDVTYQPETTEEVILRLKRSLSFGSGLHPATILSLRLLERYIVPGMNVLDLGSGSGILSVAMAKLGASVLALDNDSVAVQATQDAVKLNGVEQQVTVREGSLGYGSQLGHWLGGNLSGQISKIEATETFDLIVANILARIHIALAPDLRRALRQIEAGGGLLIAAGFTTESEDDVGKALREVGFKAVDCERLNEWVALVYRLV
ncbi:MAG: 50S ribosomal protein L11 methyltransferase [Coleofasciculaceae cyanobacterium]